MTVEEMWKTFVQDRQRKLTCIRRELAFRKNVFPKWVASGKMTQADADDEMAVLRAIESDYSGMEIRDAGKS